MIADRTIVQLACPSLVYTDFFTVVVPEQCIGPKQIGITSKALLEEKNLPKGWIII